MKFKNIEICEYQLHFLQILHYQESDGRNKIDYFSIE